MMKKTRISVVIIATVSAVCGMLLGSSAAFADEPTDPGPSSTLVVSAGVDEIPEGAVSVEAVLACDEFTGEVLAYAQEHGYCPTPGKGGVTPQAVQTYNCGSAWIYGFNNGIRGRMYVSYGFSSTQGVVVYRNLTVGTDLAIGWGDGAAMWSTSYDSGSRYVGIGSLGWHSASYSGAVTLVGGGWCTIPTITDNFTI